MLELDDAQALAGADDKFFDTSGAMERVADAPSGPSAPDAGGAGRGRRLLARALGALTICIGAGALWGWALAIGVLKTGLAGAPEIKPATAAVLMLCGASLALSTFGARLRRVSAALGLAAGAIGAIFVLEYVLRRNLGVDHFLLRDTAAHHPGRPYVSACLGFVALGGALALMGLGDRFAATLRALLALGVMLLALTVALGYFITPAEFGGAERAVRVLDHHGGGLRAALGGNPAGRRAQGLDEPPAACRRADRQPDRACGAGGDLAGECRGAETQP